MFRNTSMNSLFQSSKSSAEWKKEMSNVFLNSRHLCVVSFAARVATVMKVRMKVREILTMQCNSLDQTTARNDHNHRPLITDHYYLSFFHTSRSFCSALLNNWYFICIKFLSLHPSSWSWAKPVVFNLIVHVPPNASSHQPFTSKFVGV
jgi:hypothetical protein